MALSTLLAVGIGASVAGTAASTVTTALSNKRNVDAQNANNAQLMQLQSDLNQQQFEKQFQMVNEYNAPSNQLALKQAAGINPLFDGSSSGSSASPAGSVSLGSSSVPQSVDYAGAFNSMIQNLFEFKNLQNSTSKTSAEVKNLNADTAHKDSLVVNETAQTNSELAVNAAKINELLTKSELNQKEQDFVVQQTAANKEQVKQKWNELEIATKSLGLQARNTAVNEFNSRWQAQAGLINARSNALSAQSGAQQAAVARDTFNFGMQKWNSEFKLNLAKFSQQVTNDNIDNWMKMYDASGAKIAGFHYSSPRDISKASTFCQSFVDNMHRLNDKNFNKALPVFLDAFDKLQSTSVTLSPMKPKERSYNPSPWMQDEL